VFEVVDIKLVKSHGVGGLDFCGEESLKYTHRAARMILCL
jgi:hypothetical protein